MENINKTRSSYQKEINRLNRFCTDYMLSNNIRRYQQAQLGLFIKKLLCENRITKEELMMYVVNKKTAKKRV